MSFFDNLGQKLNDVGQTTIKKTKDLADTAKMNLEISEEERKISDAHEQIGKWYAAKYRMQADPEIQNWMDAIFASEAKIKACRDNLGQIKGETTCPQCGASIAADAQFCPNCGQKIVPQQPAQDVTPQPVKDEEVEVIPPEAAPTPEEVAQSQQVGTPEAASASIDAPAQESEQQTGSSGFGSAETSDAFTVK